MKKKRERLKPERLQAAMRDAGFGRDAHLAAKLDVAQDQIKRWRIGFSTPEGPTLQRLAEVLGTSTAYLFGRDEPDAADADVSAMLRKLAPDKLGEARGYIRRLLDEQEAMARHEGRPPVEGDPMTDPTVRRRMEASARKPRPQRAASEPSESAGQPRPAPAPDATPRRPR